MAHIACQNVILWRVFVFAEYFWIDNAVVHLFFSDSWLRRFFLHINCWEVCFSVYCRSRLNFKFASLNFPSYFSVNLLLKFSQFKHKTLFSFSLVFCFRLFLCLILLIWRKSFPWSWTVSPSKYAFSLIHTAFRSMLFVVLNLGYHLSRYHSFNILFLSKYFWSINFPHLLISLREFHFFDFRFEFFNLSFGNMFFFFSFVFP